MSIDKQKLLLWIEDKKDVQAEPYCDFEDEMKCTGALKILGLLDNAIESGEFEKE